MVTVAARRDQFLQPEHRPHTHHSTSGVSERSDHISRRSRSPSAMSGNSNSILSLLAASEESDDESRGFDP